VGSSRLSSAQVHNRLYKEKVPETASLFAQDLGCVFETKSFITSARTIYKGKVS
jgi:hypothetical protein